jgi:chromatin remodeling complex protein RSC6
MSSAPATAKRVAKKEVAAAPVAVVPAPVAAAAPVAAVAEKKVAKTKATKAEAAPVVVAAPAAVAAPVVAAATEVAAEAPATSLDDDLKVVLGRLTGLREVVSTMITEVKKLEKRVHREIKDARKRRRRVKAEGEEGAKPRGPSIFEIPTKVTDELCVFLGKPKGTLISRSNVTREINNYVKEKNLKNKHDIKPDASLKKLLRLTDADNLTYFNLQRYLNTHYIKEPKVVAATA